MSLINLDLSNEEIINKYFNDLCCDKYIEPSIKGGQSNADNALNTLDIKNYAKTRNNVFPIEKRGSSYLSAYIRHGLISLPEIWNFVEKFEYQDKTKFRDELLWQEFSRHLYAIVGKNSNDYLNYAIKSNKNIEKNYQNMNCINSIKTELESTGYMVNQTRMWFASHFSLRTGDNWRNYEDYMFKHLVDGSRFANRLGWHWVMGSQTGKVYGFSKFQVDKRAKSFCDNCEVKYNCPIQNWPEEINITKKTIDVDLNLETNFGPESIKNNIDSKPEFVWMTAESLGDNDPALNYYSNLPAVFIFDKPLLNYLQLSTKRIIFLLDCLRELSNKRSTQVYLDNPIEYLKNKNFACTFAAVPKYKKITRVNIPTSEFPSVRLVKPINFYPSSYSSWKKRIELNI